MNSSLKKEIWKSRYLYILLIPTLCFFIIFKYIPIYGVILAFKKFSYAKGIVGSSWIGLENFREILRLPNFWSAFRNTVILAGMRLVISFPAPIILAIAINELRLRKFKNFIQTVLTFPHFLSWVVISGIVLDLFGGGGVVNSILIFLKLPKQHVLINPDTFRMFLVGTDMWKEMGWGTIIYLAALSGVDPTLYEAADIDGASRFQKIQIISWPALSPVVTILLILFIGNVMNTAGAGFMQVINLYNPAVYKTGDIIDTFVYRRTFFQGASFGSSTAIGLFKSIINCILLFSANKIAGKVSDNALI
ncbi:MAG: ABC transporter permease subunit [Spirochaetaceae bacterium]